MFKKITAIGLALVFVLSFTACGSSLPYGMVKPLGGNPLPDNVFIGITLN